MDASGAALGAASGGVRRGPGSYEQAGLAEGALVEQPLDPLASTEGAMSSGNSWKDRLGVAALQVGHTPGSAVDIRPGELSPTQRQLLRR